MEILNAIRSALVAMVFTGSFLLAAGSNPHSSFQDGKVCAGSSNRLHSSGNSQDRYNSYLAKYENCTTVEDNLEIVFLEGDKTYDMSFLESIRVVNGYVLIYGNVFETLPLKNLRLIRGRSLYTPTNSNESYSLYVGGNYNAKTANVGLKEIHLTSLREILEGDVLFERNTVLCYVDSIYWTDILSSRKPIFRPAPENQTERACGQCHSSCNGTCWGPTADLCQRINRRDCASNCEHSCFGPGPTQCCHQECAGGCQGDKNTCWLCRRFSNDGECVDRCPDEKIYNIKTMRYETNPNVRYIYGANCVSECPSHKLIEAGACVSKCYEGSAAGDDRKCKKCENGVCPKTCNVDVEETYIGKHNISKFKGCTVIEGHLKFVPITFQAITDIAELNVFENVREITEYLLVQGENVNFTSLSFLRNLRVVRGRTRYKEFSIFIAFTSLKELGLNSLKAVSHGNVLIANNSHLQNLGLVSLENVGQGSIKILNNPQLCYVDTVNWTQIVKSNIISVKNHANRTEYCEPNGFVCSAECASGHGCWGKTDDDCRLCANYRFGRTCVRNCTFRNDLYPVTINGSKECRRCDDQCRDGCTGQGPDKCLACRNVKDGLNCLENCPPMKFADATGSCEPCHELCKGGCSGKGDHLGPGGCSDCHLVKDLESGRNVCMGNNHTCPDENFYTYSYPFRLDPSVHTTLSVQRCSPCNSECRTCQNSGTSKTKDRCVCKNFLYDDHCVSSCPHAHYDDANRHCFKCHHECSECHGPYASDCSLCKNYRLYEVEILVDSNDYSPDNQSVYRPSANTSKDVFLDNSNQNMSDSTHSLPKGAFNCTGVCPDWLGGKKKFTLGAHLQFVCVKSPPPKVDSVSWEQTKANIVLPVVICVIVLGVVAVLVIFLKRQLAKSEENKLRITARINGLDVEEIITPTDAKPDVSVLRLIKESELRRGNVIGSGAFGTVFKGIWIPTAENVKIPVAVKVLTESSNASLNVELLEEARIMASVNHTCCIRIIAVCMTSQMMLVTPLMPHGSLLDYVRKNRSSIGSSALLKWSAQIAKGMKYLEERGIVHRDLAARNVLVQGPGQVRITDFGLAKLLNYNEEQYKATGGKVPIKWLALESIRHCIFTHKSDVWSYGVTLWELFTYGERPYEGIKAVDMVRHLEMGERLSQPAICTIDVYMVMIRCWMIDADSRPTFCELETDFTKMTQDPGRYLVILGDRFMRLQSVADDVNTTDWFRALSMPEEEGPEKLLTADEYLRPQDLEGSHPFGHGCLQNMTSITEENYENSCSRELSLDASSTSSQTEDFKFIDLERAVAAKKLNASSSMKGRYCKQNVRQTSDPGQGDEKVDPAGAKIGTPDKDPGVNELKTMFSTNEADYLQPRSSALLSEGPNYLDVVDDSDVPKDKQGKSPTGVIENPEYLLQNDMCSNSPEKDPLTQDVLRDRKPSQRFSDNYSYMHMA